MKKAILALVVIIILVAGGAYALVKRADKNAVVVPSTSVASTAPATTDNTTPSTAAPDSSSSTITYSDSGFSPATLTVKAGTLVTIKNNSSMDLQFSSDDHPTHLKDPELNQADIGPGKTQTFTPTTKGTWGYHNHQNSTDTGTLIVQ